MGSTDPQAMAGLLSLLESRYAMRVLLVLQDGQARTFRVMQSQVAGITPNTLNTRIKELREAGLLTHSGEGYCATPAGLELTRRLGELHAFALKWAQAQARKARQVAAA